MLSIGRKSWLIAPGLISVYPRLLEFATSSEGSLMQDLMELNVEESDCSRDPVENRVPSPDLGPCLGDLPQDMLKLIFCQVCTADLGMCRLVSKNWSKIVSGSVMSLKPSRLVSDGINCM